MQTMVASVSPKPAAPIIAVQATHRRNPFSTGTKEEFGNALWRLLRAINLEDAVMDTVMHGGDTDTNAAICGALLCSVEGRDTIPAQWSECLLDCRSAKGRSHVYQPRPERFWQVDPSELAERLFRSGR